MGYFVTIVISVLILGTLLYFSNYKERKREYEDVSWRRYTFVDKGKFHFPIWCYIIAGVISLIPIGNIILTIVLVTIYICHSFSRWKASWDGHGMTETRLYLSCPLINKILEFLNKKV